ncbi:hypothetical protein [Exiguobacterium sp. CH10]|nr:hypothetical protein [Exiguobacterium sp. CH10]
MLKYKGGINMFDHNPFEGGHRASFGTPGIVSALIIIGFLLYFFFGS